LQGSNRSRGSHARSARLKRKDKNYRILQGLICKADTPSFSSVQGRPAAMGVGGVGARGGRGFVQGEEMEEGIEGVT
jgi:hypothetical protein